MNIKRFCIAVIVVFVLLLITDFIIHGVILSGLYKPYTAGPTQVMFGLSLFMDPSGQGRSYKWAFHIAIYVAEFIFAFFFTYIFTRGVEGKPWLTEGFRYGVVIWALAVLSNYLGQYSWSQMPGKILMWWIIFGLIQCVILGWGCAAVYKKEALAA